MGKMLVPTKDGDKLLKLSSYAVIFLLHEVSIAMREASFHPFCP